MASRTIVVSASGYRLHGTPLSARVEIPADCRSVELVDTAGGAAVPAQLEKRGGDATITWIERSLENGASRTYSLRFSADAPVDAVRLVTETEGRLNILVGGKLFTTYYYGPEVHRPYFHPVNGPYGDPVTRGYPMIEGVPGETTDHVHHRGLWSAHGEVNDVDNWGETDNGGLTLHRSFSVLHGGPVFGRAVAHGDWVAQDRERVLLTEERDMKFYNTGASRLMDLVLTLAATGEDVVFGDTKEAGFLSVRVASTMDVARGGRLESSTGGVGEEQVWGKRAQWCDYSGRVARKTVGVALLDHPGNIGHPTYWHARNYGLMTANPFGRSSFEGGGPSGAYRLPAGESLRLRYRIHVHEGNAGGGVVAETYSGFADPPAIEVT
jgi:hypothetical protein